MAKGDRSSVAPWLTEAVACTGPKSRDRDEQATGSVGEMKALAYSRVKSEVTPQSVSHLLDEIMGRTLPLEDLFHEFNA